MKFESPYRVYGNLAVSERQRVAGSEIETVSGDIAIFALGWESRCVAIDQHLRLDMKHILLLDFSLKQEADPAIEANRTRLKEAAKAWGVEITEVALEPSIDYRRNINVLQLTISEIARKHGSYHGAIRRMFVECSTMPRVYIQWLIAHAFIDGAIHALDFGYAEGTYPSGGGSTSFSHAVERYDTVPLLQGSGGIGEEKVLLVGIGGDADMFYGLIDVFSPERLAVLVPRSNTNTQIDALLDQQVAKVRQMYRLEDGEIMDVPAFSLGSHLDALKTHSMTASRRAVISVFVGGPKVQAIASAVFACADKRVQVKVRVPKAYPRTEVGPAGGYRLYRIVDLTSPACSLLDTW
ncbi:hypothetical protein HGO38_30495 [Rhizobium sp. CG5]|uniref:hypothetical protein n=1 Tax=Rhizobium sp. CG5 TaxID=2726076 RepID=UPI0020348519|nr:hypothetical protein [Rhizobium sp. CG5]MCM2477778.1 hypothetical protein [Rhizobium sp. CG5]